MRTKNTRSGIMKDAIADAQADVRSARHAISQLQHPNLNSDHEMYGRDETGVLPQQSEEEQEVTMMHIDDHQGREADTENTRPNTNYQQQPNSNKRKADTAHAHTQMQTQTQTQTRNTNSNSNMKVSGSSFPMIPGTVENTTATQIGTPPIKRARAAIPHASNHTDLVASQVTMTNGHASVDQVPSGSGSGSGNRIMPSIVEENDEDDEDDEDDEANSSAMTDPLFNGEQAVGNLKKSEMHFANVGILEKIRVENFMCHSCFEFQFGPNVNIIQGNNGSGKSAIVAALQLVLGASSAKTERGKNLADHIKHGECYALISVRIRNRLSPSHKENGFDDRYKPDVYGDAVVIERKITKSAGGNRWIFKDARGKAVPIKGKASDELHRIMDFFNIQVNNPVSVLTQTKSKQFLATGKPADHYKFFAEATLLQTLVEQLIQNQRINGELSAVLDSKREQLPELENAVAKKQKRFEEAKAMQGIEDKILELERKFAWAVVEEAHRVVEKRKSEKKKVVKMIRVVDEQLNSYEEQRAELETGVDDKKARLEELSAQLAGFTAKIEKFASGIAKLKAAKKQVLSDEKRTELEYQRAVRDKQNFVQELQKKIDQHRRGQGSRDSINQSHQRIQNEESAVAEEIARLERELDEIQEQMQQYRAESAKHSEQQTRIDHVIRRCQQEISNLQNIERNEMTKWGQNIPAILKAIDDAHRQGRFHQKPVGPVGAYIKLKDPKWAKAIQTSLSRKILGMFVVHDSHDEQELRRLLRNEVNMIITNFDVPQYEIRRENMPPARYTTVLDMLDFNHHVFRNMLIDQLEIERQLLFENQDEMMQVAYQSLPNVKTCWHISGSRSYSRNSSNVFRGAENINVLLGANVQYSIDSQKADLRQAEDERRSLEQSKRAFDAQRSQTARREGELEREIREQNRKLLELKRKRIAIEADLEKLEGDLDTREFEAQIRNCEAEIAEKTAELERLDEQKSAIDRQIAEANTCKNDELGQIEHITTEHKELEVSIKRESDVLTKLLRTISREKEKAEELAMELHEKVKALETAEEHHADVEKEAQGTYPARVIFEEGDDANSAAVESELEALRARLQDESRRFDGMTIKMLEKEFMEVVGRKMQIEAQQNGLTSVEQRLRTGFKERKKKWKLLRSSMERLVNTYFTYYLGKRKHSGRLSFDNSQGELHVSVRMASHLLKNGELAETSNLRTLSGGEKSFVTLSLMLALGECMEIPFRVMDEFDVFMDEANRRAAYDTIVRVATEARHRQFIFITPHALPNFDALEESVKIQKLTAPERRNASS